jgi:hypothetical protein
MSGAGEWVASAVESLGRGDLEGAVASLLSAWRGGRDPAVADAIEELGARAPGAGPAGRTRKDTLAAWIAGAAEPRTRSAWLRTLLDGNSKEALARLEALARVEPDPRIGRALAAAFADPPFQAASTKPFWKLAATLAVTHGDPGVGAALAALPGTLQARLGGVQMGAVLEDLAGRAATALARAGHVPLGEDDAHLLTQALAAARPDPRAEWRAAIDAVDWGALEDAYGPADSVAAMLHALAGEDAAARQQALRQAYGNIHHQGSVYSASVPAAGLLVRLLALPHADRADLLLLLTHLATGDPRERSLGEPPPFAGASRASRADPEVGPYVGTWEAVLGAAPAARALLDDPDPTVRSRAAFLLGFLTPEAAATQRALRRRAQLEAEPAVLAALRVADALLTRASGRTESPPPPLGDPHLDAVIAALCQGPAADGDTLRALRRAASDATRRPFGELPWFGGDLRSWARALEQSLGLRPTDELLAEFESTPRETDGRAWSDRRSFLLARVFGPYRSGGPRRVRDELDPDQRRLVAALVGAAGPDYADWPDLEGWGMFRTTPSMRRWWGADPPGPLDHAVDGLPLWKHLSDRVGGHRPPEALAALLPRVPVEVRLGAWDEYVHAVSWSPYELEVTTPHADEPPAATSLQLEQRHNDRLVDVLATVACSAGAAGSERAVALLVAQQALVDAGRYTSGVRCALGLTVLARVASAAGGAFDPRWDGLIGELTTTPPVQRTPRRTREVLAHLPADRAEAVLDEAVDVASFGTTSVRDERGSRSWRTIHCDWEALEAFRLLPQPSARHAAKVVTAVVEWYAVRDGTPRGNPAPKPLPVDRIVEYLRWAGDAATPAIEAARGGPADVVWARLH